MKTENEVASNPTNKLETKSTSPLIKAAATTVAGVSRILKPMSLPTWRFAQRVRSRLDSFIVSLVLVAILSGCSSTKPRFKDVADEPSATNTVTLPNRFDPNWLRPSTNLFTLGPGDRIEVELIGDTNSLTQTFVCPDGKIYFNVLGGVDVWGRTLTETKQLIEAQLTNYVRNEPKVSVSLREVESKRVWMLGRVQAPGVYPLHGPTTLLEGLAVAGGTLSLIGQREVPLSTAVEELADLQRSFIIRKGQMLPIDFDRLMNHGDLSQNIYLEPDDFVYLPPATAKDVFVIGAVAQPRSVGYTENLTLAGAIAGAYGTIHDSYLSHTAIVRGSLSKPQITIVDFNEIQRGRAPDVALQPHDIVYVPYTPYRYVEKYAQIILNTFAASVAINAGSSIILRQPAQPAGIFIPVGSRISVMPPLPPVQ